MENPIDELFGRAAKAVLKEGFSAQQAQQVMRATWRSYRDLGPGLPDEPSLGARLFLHLAALCIGLYRALQETGLTEEQSRERVSEVSWRVFEKMLRGPQILVSGLTDEPEKTLRMAMDAMRRFPFGAPSFAMVDLEQPEFAVAFDVLRCPFAEYFRAQELPELCVSAFCQLDHGMARMFGATLERSGTLAQGAAKCDFRFRVNTGAHAEGSQ